jgi:ABC-2 type transport system permease protein
MQIGGGGLDLFGMYLLAALVNVSGLLWSCGVAMRFRTIQAGPVMQMPVFLTLFFAPVYVPLDLLQGWIEALATVNPLTYVLESVRGLISGDPEHLLLAFALAVALACCFGFWALRGLRSAEAAG